MDFTENILKVVNREDVFDCIESLFKDLVIYDFDDDFYELDILGDSIFFTIELTLNNPDSLTADEITIKERLEEFSRVLTGVSCGNLNLISSLSNNLFNEKSDKKFYISCKYQIADILK